MAEQNRQPDKPATPTANPDPNRRTAPPPQPPADPTQMGAPEGPETERGGSPTSHITSRTNEDEGSVGRS